MKLLAKHSNQNVISFNSFSGGLNYASKPDDLENNELQAATNLEFDSPISGGNIKTADGLRPLYDAGVNIDSLYNYMDTWLFSSGNDFYITDLLTSRKIGELSGSEEPYFCEYGNDLYLASGGELQVWNNKMLKTVQKSVVGDSSLTVSVVHFDDAETNNLANTLTASQTTVKTDTAIEMDAPFYLKIDSEIMYCSGKNDIILTVERGRCGTEASVHVDGSGMVIFNITDEMDDSVSWDMVGDAYVSISNPKFDEGSMLLNGSSCIKTSDIKSYDTYSFDFWVNPDVLDGDLFDMRTKKCNSAPHLRLSSSGNIVYTVGNDDLITSSSTILIGTYSHIEFDFDGTYCYLLLNGKLEEKLAYVPRLAKTHETVLGYVASDFSGTYFKGKIDEFHFKKTTQHTADFTVPTGPYDVISQDDFDIPTCDIVYERDGRIDVSLAGNDEILSSGTGDSGNWYQSEDNESYAKFIEIGYKDNTDIVAVAPLSKDVIVFKFSQKNGKGRAFKMSGNYPGRTVDSLSHDAVCQNKFCVLPVTNDIVFMGANGLKLLSTVMDYGDAKQADIGDKINKYIIGKVDDKARIWYIKSKKQIWIKPGDNKTIFIYHINLNSFTVRKLQKNISAVYEKNSKVFVAYGTKICLLTSNYAKEDNNNIVSEMVSKRYVSENEFLIKRVQVEVEGIKAGTGQVIIDDFVMNFSFTGSQKVYNCSGEKIYNNTTKIITTASQIPSEKCNYRRKTLEVKVVINSGSAIICNVAVTIAEV